CWSKTGALAPRRRHRSRARCWTTTCSGKSRTRRLFPRKAPRPPPERQQEPRVTDVALGHRVALWARDRIAVLDPVLVFIIGCLMTVGLLTLYSAGADFPGRFNDQVRNFAVAAAVMFVVASLPITTLMKFAAPAYVIGLVLLVAVE